MLTEYLWKKRQQPATLSGQCKRLHLRKYYSSRHLEKFFVCLWKLSGGELQRFCIARALRPETRFLLCDEITAMLDLVTQAQIWEFLLDVASRRDLGLLIVSHQSLLLEKLCTRIEQLDV